MAKSLTVVVPAYNEQDNIVFAIDDLLRSFQGEVEDYEIIVVDDGSQDRTAAIVHERSRSNPRIMCLSNNPNGGYGCSYRRGVMAATKEYVGVFNGDNDQSWESFQELIKNIGQADILSLYTSNTQARPWHRRVLSQAFVILMNTLFGTKMTYLNGLFIARRDILQALDIRSDGLSALAECKVKLLRLGYTCKEIPGIHIPRHGGRSTALSPKSLRAVASAVWLLYKDIYGKKDQRAPISSSSQR